MTTRRTIQNAEHATTILETTIQRAGDQIRGLCTEIDLRNRRIAELEATINLMTQVNHDGNHTYSSVHDWQNCPFPDCDTPQRVLRVGRHAEVNQ